MNFYYVTMEENGKTNQKYQISKPHKINGSLNLLHVFEKWKEGNVTIIHQCKTYKEAEQIADEWNKTAKENGKHLFYNPDGSARKWEDVEKIIKNNEQEGD